MPFTAPPGDVAQPPPQAVAHLQANPHLAPHFDIKFGRGAARKVTGKDRESKMRFVMCEPKYLSNDIPNNCFMKKGEKIDVPRAVVQYKRLKNVIEGLGVEVLEIPPVKGCQDQTFVANVAVAIKPYIILANYKAEGRPCEEAPAKRFFENLGYPVIQPPDDFEGEAELKKLNDTTYFGGFGQFTSIKALQWISEKTGVNVIPLREIDEESYHLDCGVFVIDEQNVLVASEAFDDKSLKSIEAVANVIMTPDGILSTGITNGVSIPEKKIYLSGTFHPEQKDYREAMEWLMTTWDKFGYSVVFMDTDATGPSGAALSCQVMHLEF